MYSGSFKAGIAQKKKKQAIRRLSQSSRRGSPLTRGRGGSAITGRGQGVRGRGIGGGRGQSSISRGGHSQGNTSQSVSDNPFLKGLASNNAAKSATQTIDNPFLSSLPSRPLKSRPPPPSYDTFLDSEANAQDSTFPSAPSYESHDTDSASTIRDQPKRFLASFEVSETSGGGIPVITSEREESVPTQQSRVSFDPSLNRPQAARPRILSYSEVAALHTRPAVVGQEGGRGGAAPPPYQPDLKTLHVKGIPDELNTNAVLRQHFAQFGNVKLLKCFPSKKYATVEYSSKEEAIRAKKAGKIISTEYEPVKIFWHSGRQTAPQISAKPIQESKVNPEAETDGKLLASKDPRIRQVTAQAGASQGLQSGKRNPPKSGSIWSRLGPEKGRGKEADREWAPDEVIEVGGEEEEEEDVDEGVCEEPGFLKELGNKLTGDEMDTIARTADHPYFLRSLMQSDAHGGPSTSIQPPPSTAPSFDTQQLPDSRQLYDIPRPNVPLLPPTQGSTAGECYNALNSRDQAIRKGTVKQTVLSEARAIVGTCPDMCPEKERYRREDTRRLSWFEVKKESVTSTGKPKVDHARAIKEYSGSAADKEEPLPHDLRPLGVLQMTMDYLVMIVMDDYRERLADWYDFVWNRTRGIRKDITLQHLCSVEAAELTEKCARFHVLCSHLLCEEDTMTFDPKLNNENLNKCLLSLKQFYRDLRVEKGVYCPNEAEFCCYDILLHLTDGNVLNLVSQYSSTVRDSPEVRFAVDVALSIDSNNFVKFFKLVRMATYLNACILHRYFNHVRTKALEVMIHSYTTVKKPTDFPLSDLCRLLGFESIEKAAEFCEVKFNLVVPQSRRVVQLMRGSYNSEQVIPIRRCPQLIESKNQKQFGEVVNGRPLPPLFRHVIFSSFSSEGQSLQLVGPAPQYAPPPPAEPAYSEEDLEPFVESVICEAVSAEVEEVLRKCVLEEKLLVSKVNTLVCSTLLEDLIVDVVKTEGLEMAQKVVQESLEEKKVKEQVANSVVTQTVTAIVQVETSEAVQSVYWDCVMNAQATDAVAVRLAEEMVEECMCEGVRGAACETLSQMKAEKKENLKALRQQCVLQRTQKHWQKWRQALKVREHVRQCASDIPPLPPLMSLPWQLDLLCPLEKRRRVEVTTSAEMAGQLEESRKERERRRQEFYAPLDLPSVLGDALFAYHTPSHTSHPHTPHIHWKLTFVYPPRHTLSPMDTVALEWLYRKLKQDVGSPAEEVPCQTSEQLAVYSSPVHVGGANSGRATKRVVNVAVQGVCFNWKEKVGGSSGIMLYVPSPQAESDMDYVHRVFNMLRVVLGSRESPTRLPLLLAHSMELENSHLVAWITLRRALENYCKQPSACVSVISYLQLDIPSFVPPSQIREESLVCSNLQWLVENSPPPPPLTHMPIRDFVEKGLLDLFIPLVVSDSTSRNKAALPSQTPAPLISLYNGVLDHLVTVVTSDEMMAVDWPIPEFAPQKFSHRSLPPVHWNNPSYLSEVGQCVASLQLPPPPALPQGWTENEWSHQSAQCLDYVASIDVLGSQHGSITLLSRIKSLLHHHYRAFEAEDTSQSECSVPWAQVVLACIEHILSCLNSDLWASCLQSSKPAFTVPTAWLRAEAETSLATAEKVTNNQTPNRRKRHRRHQSDPPHLTTTPLLLPTTFPSASSTPKPVGVAGSSSVGVSPSGGPLGEEEPDGGGHSNETLQILLREKERSQKFEAQLHQWLDCSTLDTMGPTAESALSVPPVLSFDDVDKPSSLTEKLKELQSGIRAAKWKEKEANSYLRKLLNT